MTSPDSTNTRIFSPEDALFSGQVQGLVATLFQNERPPRGLAGRLDWYFHGAISRSIQSGAITGAKGECVYIPLQKNHSVYHVLLVGCGETRAPGQRDSIPKVSLQNLKKNLLSLKWKTTGVSCSDFGQSERSRMEHSLSGVQLWIAN